MKEPLTIVCTSCDRSYEYAAEKLLNGGLRGQGWLCAGGRRVCQNCQVEQASSESEKGDMGE